MNTTTKTPAAKSIPAKKMTSTQIVQAFRKFIVARAAKEGVDVSRLQIEGATLEANWGDLCGYVFFGCADEINERVANCFLAFAQKKASAGSYECQNALRLAGPRYYHEYTNGAKSWSTNDKASEFVALARPIEKGHSVATVYYPCAD
jgi:hypothetical protein